MANTRDIRLRIKGVKSTRQITRAMQMVATSKMKKAQDAAKGGRPYAMLLADIIVSVADEFEEKALEVLKSKKNRILLKRKEVALDNKILRTCLSLRELVCIDCNCGNKKL